MFWFFVPPFWMDNIGSGRCENGTGFVEPGWEFDTYAMDHRGHGGSGWYVAAQWDGINHRVNEYRYGYRGDGFGNGRGHGGKSQ